MANNSEIEGNHNIVIQGTNNSTINVSINGETQQIQNELAALRSLLENHQTRTFQTAQNKYDINDLNEDNFSFLTGKKAFNESLTKRLMTSLGSENVIAAKFLKANENNQNWETRADQSNQAKLIIASSFVGILGIQLRKLMAIGKLDLSETKQREYIANCIFTTKIALQLLCFALISELWNQKKKKSFVLSDEQHKELGHFFEYQFESDIEDYLHLLNLLFAIFDNHELGFPMQELSNFKEHSKATSDFVSACKNLQAINVKLDQARFSLLDCFDAENQLGTILVALIFLAKYKMVSIKHIGYDEMRNNPPRFLHYYAALEVDNKVDINSERLNYDEAPISTDAILLYKGRYQDSINLFPFIIDFNALTFEGGTKICFYRSREISDDSLNYSFLDDNGIKNIVFNNTLKPDSNINELLLDKEKRKLLKLDVVFQQFQEAKNTILGYE